MATQPVMLQPRSARVAFWDEFQREVELRVRECNAIAGEPLWVISAINGRLRRLAVEWATRPGARIDCSFDLDRGVLSCTPGPALRARRLRFRWTEGQLLLDGNFYTMDEALRLVLDELVCVDAE
jgi:hypothetical protein